MRFKVALSILLVTTTTLVHGTHSSRVLNEMAGQTNTSVGTHKPQHTNDSSPHMSHTMTDLNNITSIDPTQIQARIPTYRNGYGTSFKCNSACYFGTAAYLVFIAGFIAVMSVIPVQSPHNREQAPFLLWFGEKEPDPSIDLEQHRPRRVVGPLGRFVAFCFGSVLVIDTYDAVPKEIIKVEPENPAEEVHEAVQEEQKEETPVKTYESIAVETDDSLLPPWTNRVSAAEECVVIEDLDSLFTHVPDVPRSPDGSKKPGIFSPILNRRKSTFGETGDKEGDTSSHRRRSSAVASPKSGKSKKNQEGQKEEGEDLITAIEKRQSMLKRAEKRKEYVQADIDHQKLDEHEAQMYEYLEFVRELLEGIALRKVCQSGHKVVKRTFFITPDLQTVYWNKVGTKTWNVKKSSIETCWIDHVTKGISSGKAEKQQLYLTITLKQTSGRKKLEIEAKDEGQRQRLFIGFTRLGMENNPERKRPTQETTSPSVPASRAPSVPDLAPVSREERRRSIAKMDQEAMKESSKDIVEQEKEENNEEDEETKE